MSKTIIMFVSDYKNPDNPKNKNTQYDCPDGSKVEGIQTNEAPVKYLLNKHSDVEKMIGIVTDKAEESWECLDELQKGMNRKIGMKKIPYSLDENFEAATLPKILDFVDSQDEILLETTGGLRNTVMYLLLISRVLSYKGVKISQAVYSNFQKQRIEDVSNLIQLFDLIGGMQELTSFGSVRTLRKYYGKPAEDTRIENLLKSLEKLNESIILCRTRKIDGRMEKFAAALEDAQNCSDPLMRQLLPAFRNKFGEKMTVIDLIRWCVDSDMLQQALTVYTERIPAYMIKSGLLQVPDDLDLHADLKIQPYEDPDAVRFVRGFLKLAEGLVSDSKGRNNLFKKYVSDHKQAILRYMQNPLNKLPDVPEEYELPLERLVLTIKLAFSRGYGEYNPSWQKKIPADKPYMKELVGFIDCNGKRPNFMEGMLNQFNSCPPPYMDVLFQSKQGPATDSAAEKTADNDNTYIQTIENMKQLVSNSKYHLNCQVSEMQKIARDYLYLKSLRNLANHANESTTNGQDKMMGYLEEYGYNRLDDVTLDDLREILRKNLNDLEKTCQSLAGDRG